MGKKKLQAQKQNELSKNPAGKEDVWLKYIQYIAISTVTFYTKL